MDKNMLNSLLRSSGKRILPSSGSSTTEPRKNSQNLSSSFDKDIQKSAEEKDDDTIDISRSNKIYESYLSNLENVIKVSPSIFKRKLNALQNEIDSPGLHPYETDRLLFLKGILNLFYYDEHYLDEDYDDYAEQYISILDEVDSIIDELSYVTDEAWYLYYVANMFSIDRFKDIEPLDKLQDLWDKICSIELDDAVTEWKVSFWQETSQRIHDMMEMIYTPDPTPSTISYSGNGKVFRKVQSILEENLFLDPSDITADANFITDLGCDSLDVVELIMEFEKTFGITIPDHHAERISTVGDAVAYIESHT